MKIIGDPIEPDRLYTTLQVARRLCIRHGAVKALADMGHLHRVQIPGYSVERISGVSVLKWLAGDESEKPRPPRTMKETRALFPPLS